MNASPIETEALVIGAGPVGLFAIFALGRVGMRCHVVDSLGEPGGQCMALYPEKPIYDIPAQPSILAADLVDRLLEQAKPFRPVFHLGQTAQTMEAGPKGGWRIATSAGTVFHAKTVIVAAGAGAFGPNRPPLADLESYEGRSVFYMVKRPADLAGKKVVIAGGGDSAVDWAVLLAGLAAKVSVVHRRAKFRAAPDNIAKLETLAQAGKVELVIPYQLHALEGADGRLDAVVVADLDGGTRRLEADTLLPFYGMAGDLGPIGQWGLALAEGRIEVDRASFATNRPGIFAVGDIATYPGKLRLILSGFAEATTAAHAAFAHARPGQALHFEHSTTAGLPPLA
ncbi:MAG: NAD(P)/FAD-dependent oxidoreductase [Rhodospirillales bacterium]|nr:NAD(P)/FAD-dependent oxidoreductase [Rhodospirillales bacterium]